MGSFPPTIEAQRQILTRMRNEFQANGFQSQMNADALRVQNPGETEAELTAHDAKIAELEGAARNAYAAARRMDEKLAKLPKPKDDKKKDGKK